ncbi:MAG: ABC transporter ATP-binding protein [Methanosarcinaceae archaeon]
MVSLKDIHFKYPKKKQFALSNISLSISPGEIFTLLGPNGAGKTTIIRILSGLIVPHQGEVIISDNDLQKREYQARRNIGLVLGDERTFYFRLSGAQNLEFFGGLCGIKRSLLKNKITEVLELVGLENDAKLQYMRFSTGMKKRLSMARALLHDPDVLLLDEPNSGVDPHSAKSIRDIIYSLKKLNKTILLTTHDMEEAEKMSDRIAFIKEGEIIKIGKVDEYKKIIAKKTFEIEFNHKFNTRDCLIIRSIVDKIRKASHCDSIEFVERKIRIRYNGSFDMNQTLQIIGHCEFEISRTNTQEASLEDVFIKLAG